MRSLSWGLILLAGVTGCGRDFALPAGPVDTSPLAVSASRLEVVPGERLEVQVSGGRPPYRVVGASSDPAAYVRFSLEREGSGGWVHLYDAGRLVYTAGPEGSGAAAEVRDVFRVQDAAGAEVEVEARVGAPLALRASAPWVAPGGEVFLGAVGGRPPYLFGLASAPSGGAVDPVTGRYRPGAVGCTVDRPVVVDAVGTQVAGEVVVTCPPLAGSPEAVFAAFFLDTGGDGLLAPAFVVDEGARARVAFPGAAGAVTAWTLPGRPVAATAVQGAGRVVVAVDDGSPGVPEVRVWSVGPAAAPFEPLLETPGVYPIPDRTVRLVSDAGLAGSASTAVQIGWSAGARTYATLAEARPGRLPASPLLSPEPDAWAALDVVLPPAPDGTAGARLVHVTVPAPGAAAWSWYWTELSGQRGDLIPGGTLEVDPALAASEVVTALGAAGDGLRGTGRIALLTRDGADQRHVWLLDNRITPGDPTGTWTAPRPAPARLPQDARALAAGELDGAPGDELVFVDAAGRLRVLVEDAAGALQAEEVPWRLRPDIERLEGLDLDGDGRAELLGVGGGGPAVLAAPAAVPSLGSPAAGYGRGALAGASVLGCLAREQEPAILAVDPGLDAAGRAAVGGAAGGVVVLGGGALLGAAEPVAVGSEAEVVRAATAARLHPPGDWPDPVDLVAAVQQAGASGSDLRWVGSLRPGRQDEPAAVLDPAGGAARVDGLAWMRPVLDRVSGAEAVLVAGPAGLAAVALDGDGAARLGAWVDTGGLELSEPLKQPRAGLSPPERHLVVARDPRGEPSFLREVRVKEGAVVTADVAPFFPARPAPLALLPRAGAAPLRVVEPVAGGLRIHDPAAGSACEVPVGFTPDVVEVTWSRGEPGPLSIYAAAGDTGRLVHLGARLDDDRIVVLGGTRLPPFEATSTTGPVLGQDALPDLVLGRDPLLAVPAVDTGFSVPGGRFCD